MRQQSLTPAAIRRQRVKAIFASRAGQRAILAWKRSLEECLFQGHRGGLKNEESREYRPPVQLSDLS
jgi:hypothetical protein